MIHRTLSLFAAAFVFVALGAPAQCQDHGMAHDGDHAMHDDPMHEGMHYTVHGRGNDEARTSPNALTAQTVGTTQVMVAYGRPSVRDREIFGGLVPYGEMWRTGANEATAFHTSGDLMVEGERLPAGTYALFTIPNEDSWTIVFNGQVQQWGSMNHDPAQDVLRVEVEPMEAGYPVEMMSFWFEDVSDTSAEMVLAWDDVQVPVMLMAAN